MPEETFYAVKNEWDNPFTGRLWHECGGCRGRVSAKAKVCKHCGATFCSPEEFGTHFPASKKNRPGQPA